MTYDNIKSHENQGFTLSLEDTFFEKTTEGGGGQKKFITFCLDTLNNHTPSKKMYIRGNHLPFMNKEVSKEIMPRIRLRNNFFRKRSDENKWKYSKQRNYCVSLLRKTKKNYCNNLNEKKITDNKTFWKTVKPFLSDKTPSDEKNNFN